MRRQILRLLFIFAITLLVFGFSESSIKKLRNNTPPTFVCDSIAWVDSVFNSLSPAERIAQLIMAPAYPNKDSVHYNKLFALVSKYNVGGIIFFQGGPTNTANYSNKLQSLAKTPLFMGIDGEWGLAMRTDSTIVYPKQMMLGALENDHLIYQMGADIAWQLKRMGLHTNFSPVVDVNNNPRNPVINTRSFGENKDNVFAKSYAYMMGLQDNHIISTAKHFPGHGDTEADSHYALPVLPYPLSRLDSLELFPFRELINNGLNGVMVAHLNIPALDSSKRPSTLSPSIITGLLKEKMNFKGLIFTDALNMKGVSSIASPEQVAIQAFIAGNDILLMPDDVDKVIDGLKLAADSCIISYDDINVRCKKVLMAKFWLGLNNYKPIEINGLYSDLHKPMHVLNQRKLIESALTVVKNENDILPIKRLDTLRMACVSVGSADTSLFQKSAALYCTMDMFTIDRDAPDSVYSALFARLKPYNLIIAGLVNTDMRYSRKFGITEKSVNFIKQLADSFNVVFDLFANPYALERFVPTAKFKAIVVSYEDKDLNQDLSAQLIFGAIPAEGSLPVKASEEFPLGSSIKWINTIRLKYTIPEELGIDSKSLQPIDSLVNDAIQKKALPGCVIMLSKDGKVFYNKAYGHFTYDSLRAVKTNDVYDLASITKVAATTSTVMILHDQKKIDLNQRLSKYLHALDTTNKKKIIVSEVMAHQARLQPWIPIYLNTLSCENPNESLIAKKPTSAKSYKVNDSYFINCDTKYKEGIFNASHSLQYPMKVTDGLYMHQSWHDSIFRVIYQSSLLPKPGYKYSDFGFIMLGEAVSHISKCGLDKFTDSLIYKPLGASTLGYLPLDRGINLSNIAPTEYDVVFRKQLVKGYVHDPTAAMLGGICGHAGLFSTANDLAKLMQVFLNKGEYGGQRYFNESTVDLFTSRPFQKTGNRRGLGFDKPEPDTSKISPVSKYCSDSSYGHTGFTGTMTWVDPKYKLVFVFLSNRVCPDASVNKLAELNLRTNIQDVVYKAINGK
jgi:beta-N-acetylhexosaminidase